MFSEIVLVRELANHFVLTLNTFFFNAIISIPTLCYENFHISHNYWCVGMSIFESSPSQNTRQTHFYLQYVKEKIAVESTYTTFSPSQDVSSWSQAFNDWLSFNK